MFRSGQVLVLALLALLAACGSSSETERHRINFEIFETPHLVAVRDEDGAWRRLAPNADGDYSTAVTERHTVVSVCGPDDNVVTDVTLRTWSDGAPFIICPDATPDEPTPVTVTGQMLQAGQVSLDTNDDSGTAPPWTFELSVPPGTYDLIAFGDSSTFLHNDLEITSATTLPTIDLEQAGVPYVTSTITVPNVEADEALETQLYVFSGNTTASYTRTGTTLRRLRDVAGPADTQIATIHATTPMSYRSSQLADGQTTVALMPRLTGVTLGELSASWDPLPETTQTISIVEETATTIVAIAVTPQYLDGETSASVTLDIPGYEDAWRGTGERVRRFGVGDGNSNITVVRTGELAMRTSREDQPMTRFRPSRFAR
jgi:hypothetical protein